MPPQYSPRAHHKDPKTENAIRRYRLQVGRTQRQVAGELNIRLATFSSWERGQTCPTGPMLLRLAKTLDTMAEQLYPQFYFRDENEPKSAPIA